MILAILNSKNKKLIYIYCNSDIKIDQTFQNIKKRFEIDLIPFKDKILFVKIQQTWLLKSTPLLTMVFQIFGQMIFGLICYHK